MASVPGQLVSPAETPAESYAVETLWHGGWEELPPILDDVFDYQSFAFVKKKTSPGSRRYDSPLNIPIIGGG